jgi:hypothetical protein
VIIIHNFVNWEINRFLPLIRHFFLIPIGINDFIDLGQNTQITDEI